MPAPVRRRRGLLMLTLQAGHLFPSPHWFPFAGIFFSAHIFPIMREKTDSSEQQPGIRINKYLALCGYESRRHADKLVEEGVVEINGKRVDTPGVRVMPGDYVKVNGKHAVPKEGITLLLNKTRGFICSRRRQNKESTVYDLLPLQYRHVNYVGRLDTESEGLLLLTNKGELGQQVAHPSNGVEKEYWVTLDQPYEDKDLLQMLRGLRLPDGQQAKAKQVARLSPRRAVVVLDQGIKRQVRQMFACMGYHVQKLVRVRIGSLWGGDLLPGHCIELTPEQEKLAFTNPRPRKGLLDAKHAFPVNKSLSPDHISEELDATTTRRAIEETGNYHFDPADFESEEEEARYSHKASGGNRKDYPRRGDSKDGMKRPFRKHLRHPYDRNESHTFPKREGDGGRRPLREYGRGKGSHPFRASKETPRDGEFTRSFSGGSRQQPARPGRITRPGRTGMPHRGGAPGAFPRKKYGAR